MKKETYLLKGIQKCYKTLNSLLTRPSTIFENFGNWGFQKLLSISSSTIIVSATRRRRDMTTPLCVTACTENFNLLSNDQGGTQKCDFSVLVRKYPFWTNLVQKIKVASLS